MGCTVSHLGLLVLAGGSRAPPGLPLTFTPAAPSGTVRLLRGTWRLQPLPDRHAPVRLCVVPRGAFTLRGPGGLWQGGHRGHPVPCAPHRLGVWKCWGVPSSLLPLEGRWAAVGSGAQGGEAGAIPSCCQGSTGGASSPCPGTGGSTDWACGRRHPCHRPGLQPGPTRAGRAGHGQGGRSALRGGRAGVRGLQQVSRLGRREQGAPGGRCGWLSCSGPPLPPPPFLGSGHGASVVGFLSCTDLQLPGLGCRWGRPVLGLDPSHCPEPASGSAS